MEPSLDNSNAPTNNAYRPPQRPPKPKALIAFTAIACILAIASITFCVFVAMQTYDKSNKISELETKVSNLETKVTELAEEAATTPVTVADGTLTYEIIDQVTNGSSYPEKGYYVEELANGHAKVVISMGEQNSGGFNISVSKIDTSGNEAIIYVEENTPADAEPVTMAFTYPVAIVEFNKVPDSIIVQSLDGTEAYQDMTGLQSQE